MTNLIPAAVLAFLVGGGAGPASQSAQDPAAPAAPPQSQPPPTRVVDPSQPDFTIIGLPTTLRLPRFASAFRVTHRFTRSLGEGSFGNLAGDFFGFDAGAQIGLEYRFGLFTGTQIGIHRTSDRTIQFFLQQQVIRQDKSPVGIDAIATAEGTNNFQDSYSPAIGAVISRTLGRHGAVYLEPIWVNNTNSDPSELVDHNNTVVLGLGGRLRIRPMVYLVAEGAPRFGYKPGVAHASFAIERRAGGHSFQLNFSNDFGTTLAQLARGGASNDDWYIGFNISRKFF
jgi:hypothetical protein